MNRLTQAEKGVGRTCLLSTQTFLLVGLWLVMTFVYLLNPLFDVDVFWQIRLGQLMWERRALVTRDPFTYTHAGEPVPTIGWLAQLALAGAYRLGGWPLVHFLNAVLLGGAFAVAGASSLSGVRAARARPVAMACAVMLGFLVSLSNCDVRPQTIGLLCFAVFLHLCATARSWKREGPLLALVLLVWQNSHPSVSLAIIASAALTLGAILERLRGQSHHPIWSSGAGFALAILSQVATPMGWRIFEVSARNVEVSRMWLQVSEWLPPWSEPVRSAMPMFWVALLLSLSLMLALRSRLKPHEVLFFSAMTVVACSAARFVLFWGLAMVPLWACWIEQVRPSHLLGWQGEAPLRVRTGALLIAAGLLALVLVPPMVRGPLMHPELPLEGVAHLKEVLPRGRIYNYREWSVPLILAGAPAWRVAVDGRLYLFEKREWEEYIRTARGEVPLRTLLAQHRPDAFFLAPWYQRRLVQQLREAPNWQEVYSDAHCVVFIRGLLPEAPRVHQ